MARHNAKKRKPRRDTNDIAVDEHVGARIREFRLARGMSQETLARALGITFQQVQKYERGTNRVGGSRLWQLCGVLEVRPEQFFEGLQPGAVTRVPEVDRDAIRISALLSKMTPARKANALGVIRALAGEIREAA